MGVKVKCVEIHYELLESKLFKSFPFDAKYNAIQRYRKLKAMMKFDRNYQLKLKQNLYQLKLLKKEILCTKRKCKTGTQ